MLVADKLAPLPTLKDKSGDADLQTLLRQEDPAGRSFLEAAHRIDRRTSGIVVFAKNLSSLRKIEEAFRRRDVRKKYMACLEKQPEPAEGILKHSIVHDKKRNLAKARPLTPEDKATPGDKAAPKDKAAAKGQPGKARKAVAAELAYRLVMKTERYFFVEVEPLTGRQHQIRAQLSAMGWPIKGDLKYGARRSSPSGRIMLHGWRIALRHPQTGESLEFTADFPADERLWFVLADYLAQSSGAPFKA